MTRLFDEQGNVVDIYMGTFDDPEWSTDYSGDFFKVCGLHYDQHVGGYKVPDVGYCVYKAAYEDIESHGTSTVVVTYVVESGRHFTVKPDYVYSWSDSDLSGVTLDSDELVDLARGWAMRIDELVDQIDFID